MKVVIKDAYIVCENAAMIRLNKRASIIINMKKKDCLSIDRRQIEPVASNVRVSLAVGVFTIKCDSAQAIELINKEKSEIGVLIITDTPTLDQFRTLNASKCIILKDQGLYQVYSDNSNVIVKDENNRRLYRQGQSNIVPRTNPIDPIAPSDG